MIREAGINDIPAMHSIRMSVKENVLSNPLKVTENDYRDYLLEKGKGWIYESGNEIRGFAIIDLSAQNIWSLFVKPAFEKMGIGRKQAWIHYNSFTRGKVKAMVANTSPGSSLYKYNNILLKDNIDKPGI